MRPKGYTPGDYLATCYRCGFVRLASLMRKHWQGYWVCPDHWEERHPQDFVRGVPDEQTVPWAQPPPEDVFIASCTFNGLSSIPGYGTPGCMIPGRDLIDHNIDPVMVAPLCDIYEVQGVPGWAGPGCAVPNFDPFAA
jgi:hypothetical protein